MRLWWAVVLLQVGCIESNEVSCGSMICPANSVCLPSGGCATPDAIAACVGLAEGAACTTASITGSCIDGVCVPPTCGDGIIEGSEQCDGPITGVDCVTFGYDLGMPVCNARCDIDLLDSCQQFGWQRISTIPREIGGAPVWTDGTQLIVRDTGDMFNGVISIYSGTTLVKTLNDDFYLGATGNANRLVVWGQHQVLDTHTGDFAPVPGLVVNSQTIVDVQLTTDDSLFVVTNPGCQVLAQINGTWSQIRAPGPTYCTLSAASATRVAVVIGGQTVERWSGGAWNPVNVPGPVLAVTFAGDAMWIDSNAQLLRVTGTTIENLNAPVYGAIVAVGPYVYIDQNNGVLARWDGATTQMLIAPMGELTSNDGQHLYAFSFGAVYAYSGYSLSTREYALGNIHAITVLDDGAGVIGLGALICPVGYVTTIQCLVLPRDLTALAGRTVTAIYATTGDQLYLVDPKGPSKMDVTPTGFTGIAAMYSPPSGEPSLYAVGAHGLTLVDTAGVWTTIAAPDPTCDLAGIAGGTQLVAVGACNNIGVVWTLANGAWIEAYRGGPPLAAVTVTSDGAIFAAGPSAGVSFVAGTWQTVPRARGISITSTTSSDVWVGGGIDDVIHWDGLTWSRLNVTEASNTHVAVTPNLLYIAGATQSALLR